VNEFKHKRSQEDEMDNFESLYNDTKKIIQKKVVFILIP